MAIFYAAVSFARGFSGLLAFAIEKMDGIGGLAGWKVMFLIQDTLHAAQHRSGFSFWKASFLSLRLF